MTRFTFTRPLALASCIALLACGGGSDQDRLADARGQLASGAYADAIAAADAGLAGAPDPVTAWGLEIVKLEALSRSGQGDASVAQLTRLAEQNPDRISAADYSGTAQQLRVAEQKAAAIQVLDLGIKRFPDDAVINKLIEDSVAGDVDPEELDMLKSLGYID